jgi:hypothetical protein
MFQQWAEDHQRIRATMLRGDSEVVPGVARTRYLGTGGTGPARGREPRPRKSQGAHNRAAEDGPTAGVRTEHCCAAAGSGASRRVGGDDAVVYRPLSTQSTGAAKRTWHGGVYPSELQAVQARMLLVMGAHHRLGEASPFRLLREDKLLADIGQNLYATPRFTDARTGIELREGGAVAAAVGMRSEVCWGAAYAKCWRTGRAALGTGVHGARFVICKGLYTFIGLARFSRTPADYQAPRIRYIFPSAASAAFWGVEVRTGWLSLAGKSQDWAGRESFAVGDEMGLAYDAAAGSLQVFKQSRLLGTAVASGGLPGAGELVWAVAMMGADPSYDDEGQVVRLCIL